MADLIDGGSTGNSVGIDPDALDKLIGEAADAADAVEEFVSDFRGRFVAHQVSTHNLTQLEQVAEWVRDQLPMLRRRRDIAAIASEQHGTLSVTAGAGELTWDTAEEAAEQGREDAERLLGDVDHPSDEIPAEAYELLQEHGSDPDYVEAFFNAAGPGAIEAFHADAVEGLGPEGAEYDQSKLVPVSYALATASHRIDFTSSEWMDGVREYSSASGWTIFATFMNYGHWSEGFLHSAMDNLGHHNSPEDMATVMNALARHPVAAATWYTGEPEHADFDTNAEYAAFIMQGIDGRFRDDTVHDAFINVMDAATHRVARFDQGLADQSVYTLLENVYSWDRNAEEPYQEWFGQLIERHIDDVYDSVTSPVPSYFEHLQDDRRGVEAPAEWWASLTEQAMRDEDVANHLSEVFSDKYEEQVSRTINMENENQQNANALSLAMADYFGTWFLSRAANVAEGLGIEVEEANKNMETAVDIAFKAPDPKALLKDLATRGIKAVLSEDMPTYNVDTGWAHGRREGDMHFRVSEMYNNPGGSAIVPVEIDRGDYVAVYDGNPKTYQDRYGGEFIEYDKSDTKKENPKIKPLEDMDDNAKRAYLEWLQDPAVQQWASGNFADWGD
ncbi:hypothetical protein [Phytoactinopolyspora mesophila]|uniref:Uncharacterized protein n=1 Tax=Phytoactinopolyspora mesophila TaxID=2650750 RepID=A0A7K3MBT7_9ACTN|nr:hypothetical protein [Phytoactinopolyspora mesophila]NDL60736.1 hypothetical protein [Phytoactinopolyspora mesophila]